MDPAAAFFIGTVIGGVFGLASTLSKGLVRAGVGVAAIAMAWIVVEGDILALAKTIREMLDGAFAKPALGLGIVFGFIFMADEDSAVMGGGTNQQSGSSN